MFRAGLGLLTGLLCLLESLFNLLPGLLRLGMTIQWV